MENRRRHQRYSLRKGAHIAHGDNTGEIRNLSLGGLLCQCRTSQRLSPDNGSLSICAGKDRLFLDGIKLKRISEWHDDAVGHSPLVRQCGIAFEDLSPAQEGAIQDFIDRYGVN